MTVEAVIAIVVGVITVGGTVAAWIWRLSAKLKELEAQKAAPVEAPQPQGSQLDAVAKRVDDIREDVKWLRKLQIPGLEKVIADLAKEMARFTDTLDEIERALKRR